MCAWRIKIETTALKGHFIVAMPHLSDPNFHRTVVLMCEHNEEGAMGLVVNRTFPFKLDEILAGQELIGIGGADATVHYGGPVQPEVGFLIYENGKDYPESLKITSRLNLGTTLDILEDISMDEGPERFYFALGYAGWGAGQLEQEIRRNDWLVVPCCEELIFELPYEERWEKAIEKLGIHPSMLGETIGNA